MKPILGALVALLTMAQMAAPAKAALPAQESLGKAELFYVIGAHPDDEPNVWGLVEDLSPSTYMVFVILTQGEGTSSCMKESEALSGNHVTEEVPIGFTEGVEESMGSEPATGPYKYQGPNSPVDEEDKGEREPLGNPWVGQGKEACKRARVASWHWFLDDMHKLDGSGTDLEISGDPIQDDDYQGVHCDRTVAGSGNPVCAQVWADDLGARVAFDLGNTFFVPGSEDQFADPLFGPEDVIEALTVLREQRSAWGIPALPETGMTSAAGYYEGDQCFEDGNPDHKIVQDVLSTHDFGAGPQYGPLICQWDSYGGGHKEEHPLTPTTLFDMQLVDPLTEDRSTPFNENYGWLFSTYMYIRGYDSYFKNFD